MIQKLPLVSIITPTFNIIKEGRYQSLIKCFNSIHSQSYPNIEHIVVDGGSTDGTIKLLDKYQTKGWLRYISRQDKGIFDGMNKGISLAKGKYVAFLNSDDFYHNHNGVKNTIDKLEKTKADFSYAPAIIKFNNDSLFPDHPHNNPIISHVFFTMPFCHQTMFTKRSVLVKEGKFNINYQSAGDYDLVYRLCLKKYKSTFVTDSFVTYLFTGKSSINQKKSIQETIKIFSQHLGKFSKNNQKIYLEMSKNIYTGNFYRCFPKSIAEKLKHHQPYFDYQDYLQKTNQLPQLSIITITYNDKHLNRTLSSVFNQKIDAKKIEHIIIDNLSTDGTQKLVDKYIKKAPYKVVYIRGKDKGRYNAMNKGIKKASGKYLSFMNAGDQFYNKTSLATILEKSEDKEIVYGNLNVIDHGKSNIYIPPDTLDFKYFLNSALPHQASIIKKSLFDKYGFYDENLQISADHNFFLKTIIKHNCTYKHLNSTIATYYFNGISSDPKNQKQINLEKEVELQQDFTNLEFKKIKSTQKAKFTTPILFMIFNRPDTTQIVFNQIKQIKPKYLYVAADGPRPNRPEESKKCQQTRDIIKQIDWECELKTLYRKVNFGCGNAVSKAITWFFNDVKEGIILEDDCLPNLSFFPYCQELLHHYKDILQIMHISGDQFVSNYDNNASYYFAKIMHCWGWATWANRWEQYSFDLSNYDFKNIKKLSSNYNVQKYWLTILQKIKDKQIDTWDYQWAFCIIKQNGLCINPTKNLISNIGFGIDSTHTSDNNNRIANMPTYSIEKIVHPKTISIDEKAVNFIFQDHYGINLGSHQLSFFRNCYFKLDKILKFVIS